MTGGRPAIRVAVVQASPVMFDTPASLAKADALINDTRCSGADLIVFPEAFIGGYPKGLDLGAKIGMRSDAGREQFRRLHEAAIDIPGPAVDRLAASAAAAGAYLVIGVVERDGATLYCTALTFAPDGRLLNRHRKLVPTGMERLLWGRGESASLMISDTPIGRIGGAICWENFMPLHRAALYDRGVELYCAPTVDDRDTWLSAMRMIAIEGRCFVLSACQHLVSAETPPDNAAVETPPASHLIRGGSAIVDPFGKVLAGPVWDEETILAASLDMDQIVRGKFDLDVSGHYARPDLFQLSLLHPADQVGPSLRASDEAGPAPILKRKEMTEA